MQKRLIFIIVFLKLTNAYSPNLINQWLIWNVGQGQWITYVQNDTCTHYDFGGEIFALKKIKPLFNKLCKNKINSMYLSHADWDHYSFYQFILKNSKEACWKLKPDEQLKKITTEIPYCAKILADPTKLIFMSEASSQRNDSSTVLLKHQFLIPGDSTKKQEKKWSRHISKSENIHFLILGHHGSRTSTSENLLEQLPNLKMVFASARFKKYGHPHPEVLQRLSQHQLSVIRTESWGSVLMR